jgi:hypothetical protein
MAEVTTPMLKAAWVEARRWWPELMLTWLAALAPRVLCNNDYVKG